MAQIDRIIDTNLLIIANGDQSPQSSPECRENCLIALAQIMAHDHRIVIDGGPPDGSEILAEYRHKLHEAGSGFGEIFLRWLFQNWSEELSVARVPISKRNGSYEEFPEDKRLKEFDPADHKWIAVACAHHVYNEIIPEIIQAADFKWQQYVSVFQEHDVNVVFMCDTDES